MYSSRVGVDLLRIWRPHVPSNGMEPISQLFPMLVVRVLARVSERGRACKGGDGCPAQRQVLCNTQDSYLMYMEDSPTLAPSQLNMETPRMKCEPNPDVAGSGVSGSPLCSEVEGLTESDGRSSGRSRYQLSSPSSPPTVSSCTGFSKIVDTDVGTDEAGNPLLGMQHDATGHSTSVPDETDDDGSSRLSKRTTLRVAEEGRSEVAVELE